MFSHLKNVNGIDMSAPINFYIDSVVCFTLRQTFTMNAMYVTEQCGSHYIQNKHANLAIETQPVSRMRFGFVSLLLVCVKT